MLIWVTLLILGDVDGSGEPSTPTVDMFFRRRRRGWTPKS